MQSNLLPWISIISLLVYIPVLCYLDWKHRDIGTHKIWLPLLAVNIPIVSAGYLTGFYPLTMLMLTATFSLAWILLLHKRGADAVWLSCITMIAVVNPLSNSLFIPAFLIYFVGYTAVTFWAVRLDNWVSWHKNSFEMENGIPFLIPISAAFVTALVMG